jgi:hypothetical protein
MLPRADSPLRKLPVALERRQVLHLDGIRYSIAMADLAFRRLFDALVAQTRRFANLQPQEPDAGGQVITAVLLDAWVIVDSINRLRELLESMPRMRKKQPELVVFRASTKGFPDLRNSVQHLRDEIKRLAETNEPVWGSVGWVSALEEEEPKIARSCAVYGGAIYQNWSRPLGNALRMIAMPIDEITLSAHGRSVSLSEAYGALARLTAFLERMVEQSVARVLSADTPTHAADIVICAEFRKGPPDESQQGSAAHDG